MWIVKLALSRPYTFIVLAILILLLSPAVILRTPTDIFPNIDIPVISVAWTYTGLNPEDLETRLTTPFEKGLTTLVDNIEHIESTTYNGTAVVKIYLQPGASVDRANSQVVALSGFILRLLPPATQPPEIINFSASSVPVLQLGVSGPGMSEQQLNDLSLNFLRTQLITVPGAVIPLAYGGQAAAGHDQYGSKPDAGQERLAQRGVEFGQCAKSYLAVRHTKDCRKRIGRSRERHTSYGHGAW